jgi:hypothetical protein
VNHAAWYRLSDISRVNSGTIAVAEYHVVSDKTSATPVTTRTNQRFDNALDKENISDWFVYFTAWLITQLNSVFRQACKLVKCSLIGSYCLILRANKSSQKDIGLV